MARLSQIVRSRLALQQQQVADHPNADALLAFQEQGLSASERSKVLAHLALCPNCREVLALASPDASGISAPPAKNPRSFGWFALRLGPALAAICLLAISVWEPAWWQHSSRAQSPELSLPPLPASPAPQRPAPEALRLGNAPREPAIRRKMSVPKPRLKTESSTPVIIADDDRSAPAASKDVKAALSRNSMFQEEVQARQAARALVARVQAPIENVWRLDDAGALLKSDDSGSHWTKIVVANGRDKFTGSITALRAQGQFVEVTTKTGQKWFTADSGSHWQPVR